MFINDRVTRMREINIFKLTMIEHFGQFCFWAFVGQFDLYRAYKFEKKSLIPTSASEVTQTPIPTLALSVKHFGISDPFHIVICKSHQHNLSIPTPIPAYLSDSVKSTRTHFIQSKSVE